MSASQNKRDESKTPPEKSTVILLLGDIADTTWRMFLPTIFGGFIGWQADQTWHTAPWLSIIGVFLGTMVAGGLIWQQLRKVKNVK